MRAAPRLAALGLLTVTASCAAPERPAPWTEDELVATLDNDPNAADALGNLIRRANGEPGELRGDVVRDAMARLRIRKIERVPTEYGDVILLRTDRRVVDGRPVCRGFAMFPDPQFYEHVPTVPTLENVEEGRDSGLVFHADRGNWLFSRWPCED